MRPAASIIDTVSRMGQSDYIQEQLSATRTLIKFLVDHQGGVQDDLNACLEALEVNDIDSAVRHARRVRPGGMASLTDWYPPVIAPLETQEYNTVVLSALVGHWCHLMSRSFADRDTAQRCTQEGELTAEMKPNGYVFCPFCHKVFSSASTSSWDGSRHLNCGVRLRLVPVERWSK
jgi:hypothetical protein